MSLEETVKEYFSAWESRDWNFVENNLAEGFTFTSQHDDHLEKDEYKRKCWDSVEKIEEFEFTAIVEKGDEVMVRYKGRINDMAVQNIEHFVFENGKLKSVTVFFGRPDEDFGT